MSPELRATLEQWLTSGNEVERRHAQSRLGQNPEYPSLLQQATNAARAVGSVVASAVRGEAVTVSGGEQNRRMMICKTCDKFDIDSSRCRICGCFANLKTRLASQHCPDDPPKW